MSKSVYINKIAAFLPNQPVENEEMERILGQVGSRPSRARKLILRSNKIKKRYYAIDRETLEPNYTVAELAAEAIRKLESDSFQLSDIECMVCSTTMADQTMPNHGVMVHGELGNPSCEVISTSGVCVCGATALKYAYLSIAAGDSTVAVSSAADAPSSLMTAKHFDVEKEEKVELLESKPEIAFEKDFLRWMLSDGAGAMLLSDKPNQNEKISLKIDWIDVYSYANEMSACMYAGAIKNDDGSLTGWRNFDAHSKERADCMTVTQDVKQLNEFVLKYTLEEPLKTSIRKRSLKTSDYDYFLPHFSSGYFEDKVAQSLESIGFSIEKEKWFTNLFEKGNTGSASIYIILEELFNCGKLNKGEKILCYVPESGRFSTAFIQLTVV